MADSVLCQLCGVEAPLRHVTVNSNIGAIVMRYHRHTRGFLCRKCIRGQVWKHNLTNLTVGWLGVHSLIIAPIYFVGNIATYIGSFGVPAPEPGASPPMLTSDVEAKLMPMNAELFKRLNNKEALSDVATDLATKAGVSRGQVVLFARKMVKAQAATPQAPAAAPVATSAPVAIATPTEPAPEPEAEPVVENEIPQSFTEEPKPPNQLGAI